MVGASRMVGVLVVAIAAFAIVGCGGSDGPDSSVNGCVIQAATACPGADLSGADLEGAELSGADLSSTNLQDTNLSGANLTETNLSSAQIVDTDLSDADLTRANLTNATISGANLDGATLCGTIRTDGTTDDTSCPASTDTDGHHGHDGHDGHSGSHVVCAGRVRLCGRCDRGADQRFVVDAERNGCRARGRRRDGNGDRPERNDGDSNPLRR